MKYQDRVYGEVEISESVILEIINSQTLQRLKEIDQAGPRAFWVNPNVETNEYDHSRFAHSVGVYLLLRKYNASFEEQIAGLIHDISHSAFSHCVDYALSSGSEKEHTHQDNVFDVFVRKSEIPTILEKYNIDLEYILDEKNFPLKEKNLPDLCADRIDYSLRTAIIFGVISFDEANIFLDSLIAENNNWFFKDFESAKKYAELFRKLNNEYYSSFLSAVMFRVTGDYLKYALEQKYITEQDLYTTDDKVLSIIAENLNKDKKLKLLFERMENKVKFQNNQNDYDASVFCKSRVVDPLYKSNNKEIKGISETDEDWTKILKNESVPKEYFIKIIQ